MFRHVPALATGLFMIVAILHAGPVSGGPVKPQPRVQSAPASPSVTPGNNGTLTVPRTGPVSGIKVPNALNPGDGTNATGPLSLEIIDRGISNIASDLSQSISIEACVKDAQGNPGPLTKMFYKMEGPGGKIIGEMDAVFEGGQKAKPGQVGALPKVVPNCRIGKVTYKPCMAAPGDYALTVTAIARPDEPELVAQDTSVFQPYPANIAIDPIKPATAGLGVMVSGHLSSVCGTGVQGIKAWTNAGGAPIQTKTDWGGMFTAGPFLFEKPGSYTVNVLADPSVKFADSSASVTLTVAPTPVTITPVLIPPTLPRDTQTPFGFQATGTLTGLPLKGVSVIISVGSNAAEPMGTCVAKTNSAGTGICLLAVSSQNKFSDGQHDVRFALNMDAVTKVTTGASRYTNVIPSNGILSYTIPATLSVPSIEGMRPKASCSTTTMSVAKMTMPISRMVRGCTLRTRKLHRLTLMCLTSMPANSPTISIASICTRHPSAFRTTPL